MSAPATSPSRLPPLTYAGMFLLTLVLWMPFSFKTTGLIEEWSVIRTIESGSQLFFVTPDSILSGARLRPLHLLIPATAHALNPDSFVLLNVFTLILMFGKMVAVSWLVLQFLPGRRLLAFVAGVLLLLYPADKSLFALRVIQVHAATCSYLFAAYLLIRFIQRPANRGWFYLAGASVLLMFSVMTYQIALPLAIVTPLAALAFVRVSDRRLWIATAAWYGAIAVPLLYAVWALHQGGGQAYEMGLLDTKPANGLSPLADMMASVGLAYQRQVTGWATAWHELRQYSHLRAAALAGLAVFALTGAWIARADRQDAAGQPASTRRYAFVAIAAAAIICLGMAAFLPVAAHRRNDFRIYLLSMTGSAVVVALLLFWISRAARRFRATVFLTLAVPFVALGFTHALQNHQTYVNYSLEQQQVLQDTVAQAPRLAPHSFVVLLDYTGILDREYVFLYGSYVDSALKYLYTDPSLDAGYCPMGFGGMLGTTCTFDRSSLHITRSTAGLNIDVKVPYERAVFFANDVDNHFRLITAQDLAAKYDVAGYDPRLRIAGTDPTPRAASMFSCEPALSCYRDAAGRYRSGRSVRK